MTEVLHVAPLAGTVDADVALPGSKSITNRALVCAALADGTSTLRGALDADDTRAMCGALAALGASIEHTDDGAIRVTGRPGVLVAPSEPLDARLSGTTSRFVLALAALADGPVTVDGAAPLRARPMRDGIDALRGAGIVVDGDGAVLPVTVHPIDRLHPPRDVTVAGAASSQFLSGVLLAGPAYPEGLEITVDGALQSRPYVDMTVAVMRRFGAFVEEGPTGHFRVLPQRYVARELSIEADASAASYFLGAAAVLGGRVTVGVGRTSLQGDTRFAAVLEQMGCRVSWRDESVTVERDPHERLRGVSADLADISDTAQTLACVAPFADTATTISGIGFIRRKETDRIAATVAELRRCGIEAEELPDGMRIHPGTPRPAEIRTYDDHRMAMSFALIGLRTGVDIADPRCVDKTFPGFWDTLERLRGTAR